MSSKDSKQNRFNYKTIEEPLNSTSLKEDVLDPKVQKIVDDLLSKSDVSEDNKPFDLTSK